MIILLCSGCKYCKADFCTPTLDTENLETAANSVLNVIDHITDIYYSSSENAVDMIDSKVMVMKNIPRMSNYDKISEQCVNEGGEIYNPENIYKFNVVLEKLSPKYVLFKVTKVLNANQTFESLKGWKFTYAKDNKNYEFMGMALVNNSLDIKAYGLNARATDMSLLCLISINPQSTGFNSLLKVKSDLSNLRYKLVDSVSSLLKSLKVNYEYDNNGFDISHFNNVSCIDVEIEPFEVVEMEMPKFVTQSSLHNVTTKVKNFSSKVIKFLTEIKSLTNAKLDLFSMKRIFESWMEFVNNIDTSTYCGKSFVFGILFTVVNITFFACIYIFTCKMFKRHARRRNEAIFRMRTIQV